jgi:D-sedoheptulose 7-phosphate isomerase
MTKLPLTAFVLAGGLGTRLRPAVQDLPKVLAPAAGAPFLDYVLAFLAGQGIRNVVLCVGYQAGQVRAFAGDGSRWGLAIQYSEERTPLGTAGALRKAAEGYPGPFFALNGDTLFLTDLHALWHAHAETEGLATVALLQVPDGRGRGCVTLSESGKVSVFNEKPAEPGPALINAGIYILEPQALASVPAGVAVSLEKQIFPQLCSAGYLGGSPQAGYFTDIGTPESLASFERDVAAGRVLIQVLPKSNKSGEYSLSEIEKFVVEELTRSAKILQRTSKESAGVIAQAGELLVACLESGGKVLAFGNGGSAADAQHFATELAGRYRKDRKGLPALALNTNNSNLTAIANDYGFEQVFARQVAALARPGDLVIGITTSGRSPNVLTALKTARECGARTMALVGSKTTQVAELADALISVPSDDTPRIQEAHAVIIHILCDLVEQRLFPDPEG